MTLYELVYKMFNGNETARAMRYSSFVIVASLTAGYLGILDAPSVTGIFIASMGYIFGKARAETHLIEPKDRRDGS